MSTESATMSERVTRVFREVFDDPTVIVSDETTAADIAGWDSLRHINLIVALEEEFGVQFSSEEITSMGRAGDLFLLLRKKLPRGGEDADPAA